MANYQPMRGCILGKGKAGVEDLVHAGFVQARGLSDGVRRYSFEVSAALR